jgi:hypothetical protein
VVVVGRSPEKTAAVAAELPGAVALTADFARLDDVRRLAADLRDRLAEEPLRAAGGRVVSTASFVHWAGGVHRAGHRRAGPPVGAGGDRHLLRPRRGGHRLRSRRRGLTGLAFRSPLVAVLRTPAQGADTLVWLATAPDGWRNGRLHADRSPTPALPSARDAVRAGELWELSAGLVGLPG